MSEEAEKEEKVPFDIVEALGDKMNEDIYIDIESADKHSAKRKRAKKETLLARAVDQRRAGADAGGRAACLGSSHAPMPAARAGWRVDPINSRSHAPNNHTSSQQT